MKTKLNLYDNKKTVNRKNRNYTLKIIITPLSSLYKAGKSNGTVFA